MPCVRWTHLFFYCPIPFEFDTSKYKMRIYNSKENVDIDSKWSPPYNREFEFQMSEKESSTSPADDLFYKGKLLPLHLPSQSACTIWKSKPKAPLNCYSISVCNSKIEAISPTSFNHKHILNVVHCVLMVLSSN